MICQRERLKNLFESHPDEWIPLPVILEMHIAQYGTRIKELRDSGMMIENMWKSVNGERHSWFRYVTAPTLKETKSGQYELAGV